MAFIGALVVGVALHYHKIVQNEFFGYPQEWYASIFILIFYFIFFLLVIPNMPFSPGSPLSLQPLAIAILNAQYFSFSSLLLLVLDSFLLAFSISLPLALIQSNQKSF